MEVTLNGTYWFQAIPSLYGFKSFLWNALNNNKKRDFSLICLYKVNLKLHHQYGVVAHHKGEELNWKWKMEAGGWNIFHPSYPLKKELRLSTHQRLRRNGLWMGVSFG